MCVWRLAVRLHSRRAAQRSHMVHCSLPQDRWNTLFWGKDTGAWMKLTRSLALARSHDQRCARSFICSYSTSIWITHTHQTLTLLTVISFTSCSFSHTQQSPALRWPLRPSPHYLLPAPPLSLSPICKVHLSADQISSDCSGNTDTGASSCRSTQTNRLFLVLVGCICCWLI